MRRSLSTLMLVLLAGLGLSLLVAGCGNQNSQAQTALDSATAHLAKDNELYEQQMEQAAAWREAYVATLGAPNFGEGMAETVSLLDAIDEAIESRVAELEAAKSDLGSVPGMEADAEYMESARLLTELVDSEIAYCEKHQEYVAEARELVASGYPPDEARLSALELLRLELSELAEVIDAKYESAAAYLGSPEQ